MADNDPFDSDRTVIRPNPGGRRADIPNPRSEAIADRPTAPPRDVSGEIAPVGTNAIVAAAAPLLALCAELRNMATYADVPGLHQRIVQELRTFEDKGLRSGAEHDAVRLARYCLCALIDDVVLNTPWGHNSAWTRSTMVLTFYNETYGGQRFYELLSRLERDPAHNVDVLELMYVCLSIGFEGELRIDPRGAAEHARIRDSLFRTIRAQRGEFERDLSPHWRGVDARHRPLASYLPLWVIAVCSCALATGAFAGFSLTLNNASNATFERLATLPPTGQVKFGRDVQPPPAPVVHNQSRIGQFLAPEIARHEVAVLEDARSVLVRIRGAGLFSSGSDVINERYRPLIKRIGEALGSEPGRVIVEGHTDNVPIHTLRFPSNWELSKARADAVRNALAHFVGDQRRLSAKGLGDTQPIAPNTSAAGRDQNRRIEVLLVKRG